MITEAVSPGAVSPGKNPGSGGNFGNSPAGSDFLSVLNEIFAAAGKKSFSALQAGVKCALHADAGKDQPGGNPELEEGALLHFLECLMQTLQEHSPDDFSFPGFMSLWNELSLRARGQLPGALAEQVDGAREEGALLLEILKGGFRQPFQEGNSPFFAFGGELSPPQGAGMNGYPFSGRSPGGAGKEFQVFRQAGEFLAALQGGGKIPEELRELILDGFGSQGQTGEEAFSRGSISRANAFLAALEGAADMSGTHPAGADVSERALPGVDLPEVVKYLRYFLQGSGGSGGSSRGEGEHPITEQGFGDVGKEPAVPRQAGAALTSALQGGGKIPEELRELVLDGFGSQGQTGEETFSERGAFREKSFASALFGGGLQEEGPGKAPSFNVFQKSPELLQFNLRDIAEQIVQRMDYLARQNMQELHLKLQPEFLGEVLIRMRRVRGVLSAEIVTGHPAVKEMLEEQLDTLRERFQQMDLDVEHFDVLLKDGGQNGSALGRESREGMPLQDRRPFYGAPDAGGEEASPSRHLDSERRVDYLA